LSRFISGNGIAHAPQLEETNEWRSSLLSSGATPDRRLTSTAFKAAPEMPSMSAAPSIIPSVKTKPAARSTSSSGVRIVTATDMGDEAPA
jgi:hypothetical protein